MELEVVIVLMVGLSFISLLAYKVVKQYNTSEVQKEQIRNHASENKELEYYKTALAQTDTNWRKAKSRLVKYKQNYDLDYSDLELDENFEDEDENFKLSDLAKTIYPKLPPSLGNLIDKEEFHNAIIKTVEKKPDLLNTFIDKFIPKPESKTTPQQVIPTEYL